MTNLNTQATARFAAFALAVVTTFGVIASINGLATTEHSATDMAARAAVVEVAQAKAATSL